jgi:RNA polymerase sigma-70 factor (ECF subfamily)
MGQENGELIERWRRGDPAAFAELVRHWQQRVARLLARLAGQGDQIQDMCQEVFLRVFLARRRYRERGTFSTWLYRIALNVARDAHRRGRHRPVPTPDPEPPPADTSVLGVCEEQEQAQILVRLLRELPQPLREVLVLRHYEDMNFEQMSRLLKVPASTLKSRFAVALERLRQRLRQLGWSEEETS